MCKRVILLIVGTIVFIPLMPSCKSTNFVSESGDTTKAFNYGQTEVTRFLQQSGINVEVGGVISVSRNAIGTRLYVSYSEGTSGNYAAVLIATNGVRRIVSPELGRRAFLGRDETFVAWRGDGGESLHFSNGTSIPLPKFSRCDVDPGGKYFAVCSKLHTSLGRVESPTELQKISDNLQTTGLFAKDNKVYVMGRDFKMDRSRKYSPAAVCLVLEDTGKTFNEVKRYSIDEASSIVELDPYSTRVLFWNRFDYSPKLYMYDLESKKRERIGSVKGFQFFLTEDLLKCNVQ
jgi:hypothetical protein